MCQILLRIQIIYTEMFSHASLTNLNAIFYHTLDLYHISEWMTVNLLFTQKGLRVNIHWFFHETIGIFLPLESVAFSNLSLKEVMNSLQSTNVSVHENFHKALTTNFKTWLVWIE